MAKQSLKQQLLLGTLLPGLSCALVTILVIAVLFLQHQKTEAKQHAQASLVLLAELLQMELRQIPNTTHGTQTTIELKHNALDKLNNSVLQVPDLRSLTIFNTDFSVLHHFGPDNQHNINWSTKLSKGTRFHQQSHGTQLFLLSPLVTTEEHTYTHTKTSTTPFTKPLWLQGAFSSDTSQILLYQTILITLISILVIIFIAALVCIRLVHKNTEPLVQMQSQLQKVHAGFLETRIPSSNILEYQQIADTLNKTLEALQTHQDELQDNVNQSTQDLRETLETIEIQNIELDLARKEALQASRVKSEFLANTSHEIRTPLNGIIGFTRLLLKQVQEPQQREYLQTIQQSSEGLLAILNDILDLSKIEAGKLVLEYTDFNLYNLIDDILRVLSPGAQDKNLEICYLIAPNVPENLTGDPYRIKQILTNLIGNAIKFSEKGDIVIRVSLDNNDGSQYLLRFQVADTGIGIAKQYLNDDLFNAFTQTESTYSRQHSGTGLGLAISKKLVTQMGGEIGIESEENVGSTFWFTLRLEANTKTASFYQTHSLTQNILLFDMNSVSRQHLSNQLMAFGANLAVCTSLNDIAPSLTNNAQKPPEQWFNAVILSLPVDSSAFPIDRLPEISREIHKNCALVIHTPRSLKYYIDKSLPADTVLLNKPCNRLELYNALSADISTLPASNTQPFLHQQDTPADAIHILCVDDNPANLKLIQALLHDMGHSVATANSGYEAISLCQQQHFDLIFMDIQMPEFDGIACAKRIRALENNNQNTPIIALTAHALNNKKRELLLAGMDDYLSKPATEEQLQKMIQRWQLNGNNHQQNYTRYNNNAEHNSNLFSSNNQENTAQNFDDASYACVDKDLSLSLSNNKADLAITMLTMLLNDLPETHAAIHRCLQGNDTEMSIDLVHKLHGACCYCGVPQLKETSKQMEIALSTTGNVSATLITEFDEAINALLGWQQQNNVEEFFR